MKSDIAEWKKQVEREKAIERAKALRYKRPALASLGWYTITSELQDIPVLPEMSLLS